MKNFTYHSAKDSKEATKLSSSNSAFLAGGMTTIPSMKLGLASYKDIIDIKGIKKLSGIKVFDPAPRMNIFSLPFSVFIKLTNSFKFSAL